MKTISNMFEQFTISDLLDFRTLLESVMQNFRCMQCGICCFIHGKICLELEVQRIEKKYGTDYFDHTTFPYASLKRVDSNSACMGNVPSTTPFHTAICKLYDERPILCRLYPQYPNWGSCLAAVSAPDIPEQKEQEILAYFANYMYNIKRETIVQPQVDWLAIIPQLAEDIVIIDSHHLSTKQAQQGTITLLWNMWFYRKQLPLTEEERQLFLQIDDKRTLKHIIEGVGASETMGIEFYQKLLLFNLVRIPETIIVDKYATILF